MRKLTYWVSERLDDARCYSIRAKTRRECKAAVAERDYGKFGPVHKVQVDYEDAFDLLFQCLSEGGVREDQ